MKWSGGQKALLGAPVALIIVLVMVIVVPTAIATAPETTEATRLMRMCPRAVELLGKNIEPKQTGVGCGCHDSDSHDAHHILRYNGSKTTGTVEFKAEETDGRWRVTTAELLVDGERVDLVACSATPAQAPPVAPSAQLLFRFDGIVDRTTHPTLMPDVECHGRVERKGDEWKAAGTIQCGTMSLYAGTSPIIVDRGAEKGPLRLEYYDDTRDTKAMFSFGDTRDTVRLWSTDPVWEVEIKVLAESTK